jgi:hypothetical protein
LIPRTAKLKKKMGRRGGGGGEGEEEGRLELGKVLDS